MFTGTFNVVDAGLDQTDRILARGEFTARGDTTTAILGARNKELLILADELRPLSKRGRRSLASIGPQNRQRRRNRPTPDKLPTSPDPWFLLRVG